MSLRTHHQASPELVGKLVKIDSGYAEVELLTDHRMQVDSRGLVHGGFIFGVADLAAMWAVNKPTVVLASAKVKFKAPVKTKVLMKAIAKVVDSDGHKITVEAKIFVESKLVFEGEFKCVVLGKHVLEGV